MKKKYVTKRVVELIANYAGCDRSNFHELFYHNKKVVKEACEFKRLDVDSLDLNKVRNGLVDYTDFIYETNEDLKIVILASQNAADDFLSQI